MLAGFVLVGQAAGTYRLSELFAEPPSSGVTVGVLLVAVGALSKSAQYPFHAWLPGAMVAPTPISAYLHSATMVKAGVFLVGRFAPAFAATTGWRPLVVGLGATTMFVGGIRALRQHDLKLLLAFGTISQLGMLIVLFGAGTEETALAGCVLLLSHALSKAALFMIVGIVDHETGTRDLRRLPVLGRRWRSTAVVGAVVVCSMAGVPPTFGFIAKEAALDGLDVGGFGGSVAVLALFTLSSALTIAYSLRWWWGLFVAPRRAGREQAEHSPSPAFVAPPMILAVASLLLGLIPGTLDDLVGAATKTLHGDAHSPHLALWHGVTVPLALSLTAIATGALIFAGDGPVQRLLAALPHPPNGDRTFRAALRGLNIFARRVTTLVQSGSLPVYAGVILFTAAVLPLLGLIGEDIPWPDDLVWVDSWAHLPVAAVIVVAALSAATVRRRFSAALFLGAVGYAMAALFVVQGAPDLALTQTAIETLSTVLFVLVLRRLPDRFERVALPGVRVLRAIVAAAVGLAVFVIALIVGRGNDGALAREIVERSVPDGAGRNVVNVILVDFRAFDTLGEITVLASAAIGVVALARAGRRGDPAHPEPMVGTPRRPMERLVYLDTSVRLIFHAVMVGSLWLLFAGHNQPGGGFVGGLLAGAAMALRYVAGGLAEVRQHSRFKPWTILGAGLLLSSLTAAAPLLFGADVLDVGGHELELPLLGKLKLSSALIFDLGVYLLVLGLVLMVFEAFGDDPSPADIAESEGAR